MRCRRIFKYDDALGNKKTGLVFFGSCGVDENGNAIFYNNGKCESINYPPKEEGETDEHYQHRKDIVFANFKSDPNNNLHDNYGSEQEAIRDSLTQRLSVIKGELWYMVDYGFPITDGITRKPIFDAYTITVINSVPGIKNILHFNSNYINHIYDISCSLQTIYADIDFLINI